MAFYNKKTDTTLLHEIFEIYHHNKFSIWTMLMEYFHRNNLALSKSNYF